MVRFLVVMAGILGAFGYLCTIPYIWNSNLQPVTQVVLTIACVYTFVMLLYMTIREIGG